MPFTFAHAAAALPSRRLHLIPSAVVIGTFAPDFEYFLRLAPDSGFGHSAKGIFELSFPLAILMFWIFHTFVKVPAAELLPESIQRRLSPSLYGFNLHRSAQLASIAASILFGIATHVVWDSFTHPNYWPYRHWSLLRETLNIPIFGTIRYFKLFQHGSTILGMAVLLLWLMHWYRTTAPSSNRLSTISRTRKISTISALVVVALLGGIVRAILGADPSQQFLPAKFAAQAVVTAIAVAWWQLVIYGMVATQRNSRRVDARSNIPE